MRQTQSNYKELFIGLVGGVGVDFNSAISSLTKEFKNENFNVHLITVSELINDLSKNKKSHDNELDRIKYYMDKCTELRMQTNNSILALLTIVRINKLRAENKNSINTVYLIKSVKRPEEYSVFRQVYGRNFILISVHSSMDSRKYNLKSIKSNRKISNLDNEIDKLIKKDFKETEQNQIKYGQNVSSTFPKAHVFLNNEKQLPKAAKRFVDILFGYPFHTPTVDERNLFFARGVSLRSSDLSRQVGAVITDNEGDIIATGCNDVPKGGGGFYEAGDLEDKRDFKLAKDKNVIEKLKIVIDLINGLQSLGYIKYEMKKYKSKNKYKNKKRNANSIKFIKLLQKCDNFFANIEENPDSKTPKEIIYFYNRLESIDLRVTDLLEYGRMLHAEMAAICDAARRGINLKGTTLYCTTYPCHMCAKLIIAVGIMKVIYIDPYPKSKAMELFHEIILEDANTMINNSSQKVFFEAFSGISPRRFLFLFKQENRKIKPNKIDVAPATRNDIQYLKGRNPITYIYKEKCIIEWMYSSFGKNHKYFLLKNKSLFKFILKSFDQNRNLRSIYLNELMGLPLTIEKKKGIKLQNKKVNIKVNKKIKEYS